MKLKHHIYDIFNIILLNILFIVPMTNIDYTSYLSHDARWWLNQYYEYYSTFGHANSVAFHGFNHTGLAINMLYPQSILKLLETPLVILHIVDPYLVIGILTIILANTFLILNYIIAKKLKIEIPLTFALLITSVLLLTGRGIINSIPQLIATAFILIGVIAIIDHKKQYLMILSIYGMLSSSLTTSIIGAITLILIFFIEPSYKKFKSLFAYGFIGVIFALPQLYPIFKVISHVQKPYQGPMQSFSNFILLNISSPKTLIFITTALFCLLIPLALKDAHKLNKYVGIIILIYVTISAFPKIASKIMSPIQEGTFQRIWTLFSIISIFWIYPIIKSHYRIILNLFTTLILSMSFMTYVYYPMTNTVQTPLIKAYKTKNWDKIYAIIDTDMVLQDKSKQILLKSETENTAKYSPDYIPSQAKLKQNIIAYTSPSQLEKKYGVKKQTIASNKLKIDVTPQSKNTPLAVWKYDFIKYNVTFTTGSVEVKNGMFYYIGKKPATITIESSQS